MAHVSGKRHLRRIAAPKTWFIPRKGSYWIIRPTSNGYKFEYAMPILLWLRDYLKLVKDKREAKYLLDTNKVLVNNKKIRDLGYNVGLFDVISILPLNKHYRVVINKNEKLVLKEISENEKDLKLIRIVKKTMIKNGRIQVTGLDGSNFIMGDKDIKVGDSILYNTKERKIEKIIRLKKNVLIYVYYGHKAGKMGRLSDIKILHKPFGNNRLVEYLNLEENKVEQTIFDYVVAIGEDKPVITI